LSITTRKRIMCYVVITAILAFCMTPQFRLFVEFPKNIRISQGESHLIDPGFRLPLSVRMDHQGVVRLGETKSSASQPISIESEREGTVNLYFRLFGIIPFKRVTVEVLPPVKVYPGGHSIGILLRTEGVLVVKLAPVTTNSKVTYPARDAGVQVGDIIIRVNGFLIQSDEQIAALTDAAGRAGQTVVLDIRRGPVMLRREVTPAFCSETGRYRIGLWVRDGAAGVGTLTFYDEEQRTYAALGHMISDGETQTAMDVSEGRIVRATVSGIEPGRKGQPGEKIGVFVQQRDVLGTIDSNTEFGIVGTLVSVLENPLFPEPVPVAACSEVREGPAEIITVVKDQRLERFKVEIIRVNKQSSPDTKGLVIKVTDPELLKITGGIVQGMSGSPIIQNGKLVGAVTHVLVNDPTRGYGVFAEWMLDVMNKSRLKAVG